MRMESAEGGCAEERCLGLRAGEVLHASVQEVTREGRVLLGLLGVQTWVRSEARVRVGDELELLVQEHGSGLRLRILEDGDQGVTPAPAAETWLPEVDSNVDWGELESFHASLACDETLFQVARHRCEAGAFSVLPLPASPLGAWGRSGLYFSSDETGEQLVLHLNPGETGELRVDLHIGPEGVGMRAESRELADLESLRESLPEFEEALAGLGLQLWAGALRGGIGRPIPTLDLSPPRSDGRSRVDEEA